MLDRRHELMLKPRQDEPGFCLYRRGVILKVGGVGGDTCAAVTDRNFNTIVIFDIASI